MNQTRVIKLSFVILLVSFLLSTIISLASLHSMAVNNQREMNKVLAAQIYDTISIELGEPMIVSKTMANDYFLIDILKNENRLSDESLNKNIQSYLLGIKDGLDFESAFLISDHSRKYYSYQGVHRIIDPTHNEADKWYNDFLASEEIYSYDVDNDQVNQGAWTVFTDAKIIDKDSEKFLGVCGVGFHMKKSQELFYALEDEYHVKIDLIDANHLIQVDTDLNNVEKTYLNEIDLESASKNEYSYQDLGGGRYAVTKYLDNIGWYLVVQNVDTTERSTYLNLVLMNVVLFGLVTAIMAFETRKIMKRTNDLSDASFKDNNTGLLNRRAFEEEKKNLEGKILIIIAVTDKALRDKLSKMNAAIMGVNIDPFYGAPELLIVLANKEMPTYIYDGSLVMGNMMNAAADLGVASCWIHRAKEEFESEEGKAILKDLGIEGDYEGIGHLILGYAAKPEAKPAPRKADYVYRV